MAGKKKEVIDAWNRLRRLATSRQEQLFGAHEIQRFNRDADETIQWINEKDALISSDDSAKDLASVQALQRKHEGVERDLAALEVRLNLIPLSASKYYTVPTLEEAGFVCPKLSFALRNPLQVSNYAQEIVQNRAKNLLFSVLTSPIEVDRLETNIPDGQVIMINNSQLSFLCAFNAAIEKIPALTFALFFCCAFFGWRG